MRARVRFAKTGKLRFISAIDLGRVWERALRKSDLPVAYSEGFSPRPKISFGDALPLGFASTAEYGEVTFEIDVNLDVATTRLNDAFPAGCAVLDAGVVPDGSPRLGKKLRASLWEVRYPEGVEEELRTAADNLTPETLIVVRERKDEMVTVDIAAQLAGIVAVNNTVRAVVHHPGFGPNPASGGPAMRPDDLHRVLSATGQLPPDLQPNVITRVAQGVAVPPDTPTAIGVSDALRDTVTQLSGHPADAKESS